MSIPTEADWRSERWDLDVAHAYGHFFGKSIAEALDLFAEDALTYQEDILFMPFLCFRYYLTPMPATCSRTRARATASVPAASLE